MRLPDINVKKILYATDLSESARYALAYAISLANVYKASLTILHVMADDPDVDVGVIGYVGEKKWEEIKKRNEQDARSVLIGKRRDNRAIQEALEHFCKNVGEDIGEHHGVMDETLVMRGKAVDTIISVAEERDCDLIVMGSYGHGGLAGAIMGSTAQRVLRRSKKPVLVVHLPEDE